jgi:uncharacterized protein YlxW (UPF0749 family)
MNPFANRQSIHSAYVMPVSLLALVLGFLLSLAWITDDTREARLRALGPDQAARIAAGTVDLQAEYHKLQAEVSNLRQQMTRYQNAFAKETGQAKLLNETLQETKLIAGLTEVEGPGVTITLRDLQRNQIDAPIVDAIIHDTDVLRVVNELWAAGAEAMAVNGHRVVQGTSFRCVGPVIHVDGAPIATPVVIQAIGDPATLRGAMELPGGILAEIKETGPEMVDLDVVRSMRLPAFGGSTAIKYARVPQGAR